MNAMTNLVGWISVAHPPMPQNTPHVRPGYKQTEVGVIPEDWEVRPLGELTTTVASGRSKSNATYGNYAVHGSTGVIGYSDTAEYKGDAVLVARVGANAGKLNIVSGEYGVTDNTIIVRFGSGSCLPFFWRQMESKNINSLVFGSGQPLITGTQLKALAVCVPPPAEQRAIATALSDVDALLAAQDKLIAKKRDIKQAAMQQLLTGKQRLQKTVGSGELIVDSEGNPVYFNEEWEVKRMGDLLRVRHGKSQHHVVVKDGQYPILATGGQIGRTDTFLYDKPSVLIGRKGTIDKPQFQDAPFWTVDTLFYTELSSSSHPKFIFFKFLMIDWRSYNEASGVPSLNASTIESIEIAIPKYEEQTAIAAVLSDMDADLTALEQQRDKTRALKQGMMQELLTGRIRLV